MKNYNIKITGSGTQAEIIEALVDLVKSIHTLDNDRHRNKFKNYVLSAVVEEDQSIAYDDKNYL